PWRVVVALFLGRGGTGRSAALGGLLRHLFDRDQARVPPCRDPCQSGAGLAEASRTNHVADFAAGPMGRDKTIAFKDCEVLGDALSRNGQRGGERARRCLTSLEQEVEQAYPHRVAERGPQAVCLVGARSHRSLRAVATPAA